MRIMSEPLRPISVPHGKPADDRLDSWKAIAKYLGREVRTVQGWEKNEGLPVHRHLHAKLGSVYAFRTELDAWRRQRASVVDLPESNPPADLEPEPSKITLGGARTLPRLWIGIPLVLAAAVAGVLLLRGHTSAVQGSPSSVAVLPFLDLSPTKDQEYFSDGLTEQVIDALAGVSNLHVVARTSAFSFKGTSKDVREIGKELNVASVLEGSLRKANGKLRITVQLIRAEDGYHYWSQTIEQNEGDPFAVQDAVARAVVARFSPEQAPSKRASPNAQAFDLYLSGRRAWADMPAGLPESEQDYLKALKIDPQFALAWTGLAETYAYMLDFDSGPAKELAAKARKAADKALELDPNSAEAHTARGIVAMNADWDWSTAERELTRALQLKPSYAYGIHWYGHYLENIGKPAEGLARLEEAQRLDPLSPMYENDIAVSLGYNHRYADSLARARETASHHPEALREISYWFGEWFTNRMLGNEQDATRAVERVKPLQAQLPWESALRDVMTGDRSDLARLEEISRREHVVAEWVGLIYLRAGEKEKGLEWLNRAVEDHSNGLVYTNVFPLYDPYRSDPRFVEILKRVGVR
jgi:adenylate cyclase